jgi:uncharacterized membrane protein
MKIHHGAILETVNNPVQHGPNGAFKRLLRHILPVLAISTLPFFLPVSEARADFKVCNGTQNLVGVAIGYRAKDGWVTEGWWQVPATTCATLIEGDLKSRYYYLYAEDAARGGRWTGDVKMCVAENEFKITGVKDCFARGYQQMGFKEYDTGKQGSWMVQLSDATGTQESQTK